MKSEDIAKLCGTVIVVSIIFMFTSCQQTAEEIVAEAKLVEATTKQLQVEKNAKRVMEQDKMNNVRILIQDENISPFAARCAVYGPNGPSNSDDARCADASKRKIGG